MSMRFGEGYFPSFNKVSQVYYCHYTPDMPRGVVLLVHGMSSYAGAYRSFAERLCENGYAVYAYDLLGHGRTVGEGESFGTFAERDGDIALVKDLEAMTATVRRRFRQLPFFVYAHSLGSFIVRAFLASHRETFDGVVLSGTAKPMVFSFFKRWRLGRLFKKAGRTYSPAVERAMLGSLVSPFLNERGSWLTTDPDGLLKKGEDPYIGHKLKADAYGDIFKLLEYISSEECLDETPRATPILFLAGERDALGGRELVDLVDTMDERGFSKVAVRIYEGEKHELLVSLSRERVISDILAFLNEETDAVTAMRRQAREGFGYGV